MTIELNREAIARIAALPGVAEAAEAGSALTQQLISKAVGTN